MPTHARDRDDSVLERLPERLEGGSRELRQLVQEQNAAMGECAGMSLDGPSDPSLPPGVTKRRLQPGRERSP
jgi:hypothetical protein